MSYYGSGGYGYNQGGYNRGGSYQQPNQQAYGYQRPSYQQPSSSQNNRKQVVGSVSKVHDKFCFIDGDIFCQLTLFRSTPRVGDRYHVEAEYNPQMPFKWNAIRVAPFIQQEASQPSRSSYDRSKSSSNSYGSRSSSGFQTYSGASSSHRSESSYDRKRSANVSSERSQRDSSSRSHYRDERRDTQKDSYSRDRHSARDSTRTASSRDRPSHRSSDSFPYSARPSKHLKYAVTTKAIMPYADLHKRNNERVQIPPYFQQSNVFLWDLFQGNNFVNFVAPEKHLAVHVSKCAEMNKFGSEENEGSSEALSKSVRILMFAGPSKEQVLEKSAKEDEKSTRKLHKYNQTVTKSMTMILENTKGNHFLPGGSVTKADGENLEDHQTLVNAAVRICKQDLGLDLSSIQTW